MERKYLKQNDSQGMSESDIKKLLDAHTKEVDAKLNETVDQVIEGIKSIPMIQGAAGKDANEQAIVDKVLSKFPKQLDEAQLTAKILAKVPKVSDIAKNVLDRIPKPKSSLKMVQEKVEIDPMSVIDKILALPPEKFQLKTDNIDGFKQTISAFQHQLGTKGYLHGSGISNITDLIVAGNNVTITGTGTNGDPYIINATGGGGGISLETNGNPNGSQTVLNLVNGANTTISDDGFGNITFDSTGGGTVSGNGTDNHITRWDGTNDIQDSLIVIDDGGVITSALSGGLVEIDAGANYTLIDDTHIELGIDVSSSYELFSPNSQFYLDENVIQFETQGGNKYRWRGAGGQFGYLDFSLINTSDKTYAFPNASGTLMLIPASPETYTISNVATTRTYDASSTDIDTLADTLGTLIADLTNLGLLQ